MIFRGNYGQNGTKDSELPGMWETADFEGGPDAYCCLDDCCGPGSWCCSHAKRHYHLEDGTVVFGDR